MSEARAAIPPPQDPSAAAMGLAPGFARDPSGALTQNGKPPDVMLPGGTPGWQESQQPLNLQDAIKAKWIQAGATPQAADGIARRVQEESGGDPMAVGDHGTSLGLYQHHSERAERLIEFAKAQGKSPLDPMVQTDFAIKEMHGGDPQATAHAKQILQSKDPNAAYMGFTQYFERPATMAEQWTTRAGMSPEARALLDESRRGFDQYASQSGELIKAYERLSAEGPPDEKERKEALEDLRRQSHEMAERWNELSSQPPVEKPVDMLANFGSLGTALMLAMGLTGRHHLSIALAGAGVMMQGINANNHQQFLQGYQRWKDQTEMGLKMIDIQRQEIRDVMDDRRMDRDEWAARLNQIFQINGMQHQAEALREGNLDRMFAIVSGTDRAAMQARNTSEMLKQQAAWTIYQANLAKNMPDDQALADALQRAGISRAPAGATTGQLSKDAIDALVEQAMRVGAAGIMPSLPRSGPARIQFENALAERLKQEPGGLAGGTAKMLLNQLHMAEAKSAATTAGRVTINTELYSQEAAGAGRMVIEASKLFPRTNIPRFNQALAAYEAGTGDPNIIRFGTAINALVNAYGKMTNPTGTGIHDADKESLRHIIDTSLSQGQIEAGVEQILAEGRNVSMAAQQAQVDVLSHIVPGGSPPGAQPAPPPPPAAAATLPPDLPSPAGHPEGSVAKDASGKVVAKISNGQWVPP